MNQNSNCYLPSDLSMYLANIQNNNMQNIGIYNIIQTNIILDNIIIHHLNNLLY